MKKILHFLKNKFVIAGIIVIALIAGFIIYRSGKSGSALESTTATTTVLSEVVSVTGKVTPFGQADLGFEKGGTIASINVKVGDHVGRGQLIASVKDDQTYASLLGAEANLAAAQADLTDNQTNTQIDYTNAQKNAINASRSAYTKINNVVLNQIDTFFRNGPSSNPTFVPYVESYNAGRNLELTRIKITEALQAWKKKTEALTSPANADVALQDARRYTDIVNDFTNQLSTLITDLTRNGSGTSQATIDTYLATVNSANTNINSALSEVTTAENALNSATPKSVKSLEARIAQAQADVSNYQAQYAKSRVTAPFAGIVTKITPQLGDIVSAGQTQFSVMADQSFKVEVNVPEADIAKIKIGDKASITLDAYGDDNVFTARVILIDPAETVVEGVPTYKVTLQFDERDERVRSGMTANIDIVTATKADVVAVPFRAVVDENGEKFVRTPNADGKTFTKVPVTTGLKGSNGMVEITSGIEAGAEVVTYTK